jgi:hypothetical protein
LVAIAISHLLSFPAYDALFDGSFDSSWDIQETQFREPLTPRIYDPQHHEAKSAFRLTVPVVAHILGLQRTGALVLSFCSGVLFLFLAASITHRETRDRVAASLTSLGLAGTFVGACGFVDHRGMFDSVAIALLAASMWVEAPLAIFGFVLASAFTDERAFIASPLVMLWHAARLGPMKNDIRASHAKQARCFAVVAMLPAYAIIRIYLGYRYGLKSSATAVGFHTLALQLHALPLAFWTALEGFWLLVAAACGILVARRQRIFLVLFTGAITAVLMVAFCVEDLTRSAIYVVPAVFVAVAVVAGSESRQTVRRLVLVCAAASILAPTYYVARVVPYWLVPMPLQIMRMIFVGRWNTLP